MTTIKKTVIPALLGATIISTLFLSGCMLMHGDMMGHGSSHQQPAGKAMIKEVQKDNISVTLEVPALMAAKESTLAVTVKDIAMGKPVSGAQVRITVSKENQTVELDVPLSTEKGVYEVKHSFVQPGLYEITAKAAMNTGDASPVTVSVSQKAEQPAEHKSNKFSKPLMILGGIGMGLMMVLMFL